MLSLFLINMLGVVKLSYIIITFTTVTFKYIEYNLDIVK